MTALVWFWVGVAAGVAGAWLGTFGLAWFFIRAASLRDQSLHDEAIEDEYRTLLEQDGGQA